MKKTLLFLMFILCFGFAPHVFAQSGPAPCTQNSFCALAPIPGLDQSITPDSGGITTFLNNLYKFLIGLAAAIAVIEIVWGGLEISTKDSVSKNTDGKERITQAILGLILVLSPVLVFTIINPSILNFSTTFPPVTIPSQTSSPASPSSPASSCNPTPGISCNYCTDPNNSCSGSALSQCSAECSGGVSH